MDDPLATFEVDEPGFRGRLTIHDDAGGRRVRAAGTRPGPGGGSAVDKDLPAGRDPRLAELTGRCLDGDAQAAVAVLRHVGVLDPD